jgi:hypothetical protein
MTRTFRLTAPEPLELDIHKACVRGVLCLGLDPDERELRNGSMARRRYGLDP